MPDPFAGRTSLLNDAPIRDGDFVLYWMQQSQRARFNHALEYAIRAANQLRLPTVVVFGLTGDYPEANLRHYHFMLEGLSDVAAVLAERGVHFVVRLGDPPDVALAVGRDAATIVCDRGYLRHQRDWRHKVGRSARCAVVEVESELIVPVEVASLKREYAARTIRPRIQRQLETYLVALEEGMVDVRATAVAGTALRGEDLSDINSLAAKLHLSSDPGSVGKFFRGGQTEAERRLKEFLTAKLSDYAMRSGDPSVEANSRLSPYLHFGQVSSLQIALEMRVDETGERVSLSREKFLEQLIVRRGLAHNYVWYTRDYDRYGGVPEWARRTFSAHTSDPRPAIYSPEQLVACETHDPYWNDAMAEMVNTGYMHNYMRMYWAKKILEWSPTPEQAFATALELNNRYFLDGRDPNSYTSVAWTFGLHDRPWAERPIFGTVRYMNANGLERKFDMDVYHSNVERLVSSAAISAGVTSSTRP